MGLVAPQQRIAIAYFVAAIVSHIQTYGGGRATEEAAPGKHLPRGEVIGYDGRVAQDPCSQAHHGFERHGPIPVAAQLIGNEVVVDAAT